MGYSHRLQNHDYAAGNAYFITICAYNRQCLFGDIVNEIVALSDVGDIVERAWTRALKVRPDVDPVCHVVMPNHFHALFWVIHTETEQRTYVGKMINLFKGEVTKQARIITKSTHIWQPNYHDHIVRNREEEERIASYIFYNPSAWSQDRYYK